MSKKVWIAGLISLVLVLAVAGAAVAAPQFAEPADPPNPPGPRGGPGRGPGFRPPHLTGEITELGDDQFTMTLRIAATITVEVDEQTQYIGSLDSFADLEEGMQVAVAGKRSGEGTLLAKVLMNTADKPLGTRIGGEVTAVGSNSLTIETPNGEKFVFNVDSGTDFLSRENAVNSLADIQMGNHVKVLFEQTASGTLTANLIVVAVGPQPESNPSN